MRKEFSIIWSLAVAGSMILSTVVYAAGRTGSTTVTTTAVNNASKSNAEAKTVNPKITKEKALKILEDMVSILNDKKLNEKDYNHDETYQPSGINTSMWSVSIYPNTRQDSTMGYNVISATIDASTGEVLTYNQNRNVGNGIKLGTPVLTKDEAGRVADNALKKLQPDKFKEAKRISSSIYSTFQGYYFNYKRVYKGLNVEGDSINIAVDPATKLITQYSCYWKNLKLPEVKGVVPSEKANETLKKNIKMILSYEQLSSGKLKLVYAPSFEEGNLVDAMNNNIIRMDGTESGDSKLKQRDITPAQKSKIKAKVKKTVQPVSTEDEARKVVTNFITKYMKGKFSIENLSPGTISNGITANHVWNAQVADASNPSRHISIQINKDNGAIIGFYIISDYSSGDAYNIAPKEPGKPILTWEQAYDKAIEVIGDQSPDIIDQIDTKQSGVLDSLVRTDELSHPEANFYYRKIHNGIPINGLGISVQFDLTTGEITNYNNNFYDDIVFDDSKPTVSAEQAKQTYLSIYKPVLVYEYFPKISNSNKTEYLVKGVYELMNVDNTDFYDNSIGVDAKTGILINYMGNPIDDTNKPIVKFNNNWASRELQIFNDLDILPVKNFSPDKAISKKDMIMTILKVKGFIPTNVNNSEVQQKEVNFTDVPKDSEFLPYLKEAIREGIVENKKGKYEPDALVTRQEMAKILVGMMENGNDISKLDDMFKLPFKDQDKIDKEYRGYVALCSGFGLVPKSDNFRPKDNATWAEMVYAIYHDMKYMTSAIVY